MPDHSYSQTTDDIHVIVAPAYLDDQSRPEDHHYVWSYHVRIENGGRDIVRLHSRYWRITDANGRVQEVEGEGVVGQQPVLGPGESFEYTSGTPLAAPGGIMLGTYRMVRADGSSFTVRIPAFSLDSPFQSTVRH